jgi:putative aldouronate transport system substrate-binding protein
MMKVKNLFFLCLGAVLITAPLTAGGSQSGSTASSGQVQLSAPGVIPFTREKSTLDIFIVQDPGVQDIVTNTAITEFEAATNVHFNMTVAIEDAAQKLNLLLNTGEYPEVIFSTFTATDLVKYGATEKILLPLNDLIEQHAPNIKSFFAENPWVKESITSSDGNIYGIPSIDSGAKGIVAGTIEYKLWFNTTWLDKLGLKSPTTTNEFRDVLRAFKTRDPNGNGRADEIPLTGAYGTWAADPYLYVLNAFGYYHTSNIMLKNDRFSPVANQDYIRDGLVYLKGLYDEGLLDSASLTQTLNQMTALGGNPDAVIVGSFTAGHFAMGVDINNMERSVQYSTLLPLTGPTGYRGIPSNSELEQPTAAAFVITDKCKNPALAIKVADLMSTMEWANRFQNGRRGVGWTDADPGTFGPDGVTPAKYKYISLNKSEFAVNNDILIWSIRLLEPDWRAVYQMTGSLYDVPNYEERLISEVRKQMPYIADVQVVPPLAYTENAAARLSQVQTAVGDYVTSAFVEFITGRRSLDNAGWNTYKQDLERLGYSEYVSIMQNAYDARRK